MLMIQIYTTHRRGTHGMERSDTPIVEAVHVLRRMTDAQGSGIILARIGVTRLGGGLRLQLICEEN